MPYTIELKHTPRRHLAVVRFRSTAPEIGRNVQKAFGEVHEYLSKTGTAAEGPAIARYEMHEGTFDVAAGFPVPEPVPGDGHVVPMDLPECDAAVTTHVGEYGKLEPAYAAIQSWMHVENRHPSASMWEEYWSKPGTPPEKTRTDVYWPIRP